MPHRQNCVLCYCSQSSSGFLLTKGNLDKKRVYLTYKSRSQSIVEGSWGRQLKLGLLALLHNTALKERTHSQPRKLAGTMRMLLAGSIRAHAWLVILYSPGPPAQGMVPPIVGCALLYQLIIQTPSAPQTCH